MNPGEPGELRMLQSRNGAKNLQLLAVLQLGLEPDHVEQSPELVVLPQLHDRVGLAFGRMRIGEAERFERPVPERLRAALGHDFDRQAALEIRRRFPFVEGGFFAGDQRGDERLVLIAVERTIDVIGAMASKKASASSLVSSWIARASAGEVRGPVAMMTESQSCGGSPAISSRRISISGWLARAWVTAVAKPSQSTASAPPAGTWF